MGSAFIIIIKNEIQINWTEANTRNDSINVIAYGKPTPRVFVGPLH